MSKLMTRRRLACLALVAVTAVAAPPARTAVAGDLRDQATSLDAIPADAALYAAWLNNAEQLEVIRESAAWRKLMTIPVVQMGLAQVQMQWQFPTDERLIAVKDWMETDQAEQAIELLKQMGAKEVVLYVDGTLTDLVEIAMEANSLASSGQMELVEQLGQGIEVEEDDAAQAVVGKVLKLLEDRKDQLKAPTVVLAFRLDDSSGIGPLLDFAQQIAEPLLEQAPVPMPLAERLDRFTHSDVDLLTFSLDASMIPWDQVADEVDDNPEALEAVKAMVEDQTLVAAVGRLQDFLVVSVGPTIDHMVADHDGPLLVDTPEMKRLAKHADERLTSIGYVSGDLLRAANSNEKSFEDLATMGKAMLTLVDLDDDRKEAIEKDIDELKAELLALLPEPGAVAAATFMTDRGYETYTYNWAGVAANVDASRPLSLVDHLGEDSLGWFVGRSRQTVEGYDKLVGLMGRVVDHAEAIGKTQTSMEDWEKYEAVRDLALPVLERLHNVTRDKLIPAMADGQGAIVLDASVADEKWCEYMADAPSELALPTLSLVYAVSDAELLRQGAAECFDITQQVINLAAEMSEGEFSGFELPEPEVSEVPGGMLYSYPLPAVWGASDRVAPHACLGESVLVLGVLPELSQRLLAGTPPALDGPINLTAQAAVSAGHFRLAKVLDVIDPWFDFGIQTAVEKGGPDAAGTVAMIGMFRPQVDQLLDVLQVFDSWTVITYREDDAWVTHSETRVIDLEE